jgi:hypothetical protein
MSLLTACGTYEVPEITTEITESTEATTEEETTEATTEEVVEEESLFKTIQGIYMFTSGVGGWGTELEIKEDGTFTGTYHDSDMGVTGDGYPNGTVYQAEFSGTFSEPQMIDEYTYSMNMESLTLKNAVGEEEIIDGVKYVYSDPYGLDNAEVFEVYLPGKPTAELSEEYISWARIKFWGEDTPETLDFCGLYNVNGQEGFVQEEIEEENEEVTEEQTGNTDIGQLLLKSDDADETVTQIEELLQNSYGVEMEDLYSEGISVPLGIEGKLDGETVYESWKEGSAQFTYSGKRIGDITVCGVYPGLSENEVEGLLEDEGFYKTEYGGYATGEKEGDYEISVESEAGAVTSINICQVVEY